MTTKSATTTLPKETKNEVELFEEDDEFEEFDIENWDAKAEMNEEQSLWGDNWDDDDVDDQFLSQLRTQLQQRTTMKE
jgi:hypothetical protein